MDVLVYSALNEQASLKKQVADKQKELFDLKQNASAGGGGGGAAESFAKEWLVGQSSVERELQLCPQTPEKWSKIYDPGGWTGGFKVCDATGYYRCGSTCTWTVPGGITKARFQLWGAGGGANYPGRCCGFTLFGSTGAYLSVIIPVTAGNSYSICGGCAYCCWGEPWSSATRLNGCPSYVTGPGLCYVCAEGGDGSMGMYYGMRMGKQNPCYGPCMNNAGNNGEWGRVCNCGGAACFTGGNSGGFIEYLSGSGYYGTTHIASPTAENVIYGLRGQWSRWCIHDNNYGCFFHPKIIGFEESSNCIQDFTSNTCCGGGWRAQNGYLQVPSAGGWMSHAMGGCVSHCGDQGRMGMVCVQYQ